MCFQRPQSRNVSFLGRSLSASAHRWPGRLTEDNYEITTPFPFRGVVPGKEEKTLRLQVAAASDANRLNPLLL